MLKFIELKNCFRIYFSFCFILLIFKSKFLVTILDHHLRLFLFYINYFEIKQNFQLIYTYDICLEKIQWIEIVEYHNLFITVLLLVNIVLLVYTNNKLF